MVRISLTGMDRKRLRRWMMLFFLALAIPTGVLVFQAYSQLKWEAFHQHRVLAEELTSRIDSRLTRLLDGEEVRSFADYSFLNVAGDPAANILQRSPLSAYPVTSSLPGLLGYFQVDDKGVFSTPLLPQIGTAPESYGIPAEEWDGRRSVQGLIQGILSENRLVQRAASEPAGSRGSMAETGGVRYPRQDGLTGARSEPATTDGEMMDVPDADDFSPNLAAESQAEQARGQAAFDRLNTPASRREQEKKHKDVQTLGRVEDLQLDNRYQAGVAVEAQSRSAASPSSVPAKTARKERSILPEPVQESETALFDTMGKGDASPPSELRSRIQSPGRQLLRIRTFESEIDPFEFSLLDSGHLVFFRKVWRDGQRYIQGALLEQQPFLQDLVESAFRETALSQMSDLIVAYQGDVLAAFSGRASPDYLSGTRELAGSLLYQARLSAPLGDLQFIYTVTRLPAGAGGGIITWTAVILALVLCCGFYLMYRLAAGQMDLARQQQDFVSAVSHELKTPLTSIRMYGEMLREGWASEEKKTTYYDYIYSESERLSRLITNVLQLARMTRNELQVDAKAMTVSELLDAVRSKIASHVERAGFLMDLNCSRDTAQAVIRVDPDWFIQIIINLVDNAMKFSASAEKLVIDIGCQVLRDNSVQFCVRDYGPGVPGDQMKKIFRLFYRTENELTRETVGTGIGLALVQQLATAMDGEVDVVNKEPGAEFRVRFKSWSGSGSQAR